MSTATKTSPAIPVDDDAPLWGAKAIAIAANVVDARGEPDMRRIFYLLEQGHVPATKAGRAWVTTKRRLRRAFAGEAIA